MRAAWVTMDTFYDSRHNGILTVTLRQFKDIQDQ